MKRCTRDHRVCTAADPVLGLRWLKAPSGMGKISTAGVLRLRAIKPSVNDRSARRFAQADQQSRHPEALWLFRSFRVFAQRLKGWSLIGYRCSTSPMEA